MKFEELNLGAKPGTIYEKVMKAQAISACCFCQSFTRWYSEDLQEYVCSQECLAGKLEGRKGHLNYFDHHRELLLREAQAVDQVTDASKDIIIVVHNQYQLLKECIESIRAHTKNYKLYIWNNASDEETSQYLASLQGEDCVLVEAGTNIGFIEPNNELVKRGAGEYVILLNSDTKVSEKWTDALLGWLQQNPNCAAVGYCGGLLDEKGMGTSATVGGDIDYVCGWALCFSRKVLAEFGLFSPDLHFAYAEDADFSLRLKEGGKDVYALASPLVFHHGNQTIKEVVKGENEEIKAAISRNHDYIRSRWADYLQHGRVLARKQQ